MINSVDPKQMLLSFASELELHCSLRSVIRYIRYCMIHVLCVCMYVCMYIHMYVCMYICMYVCIKC